MSMRRRDPSDDLRMQHQAAQFHASVQGATPQVNTGIEAMSSPVTYDELTPTEQAVASLGVQADALKPIQWMNDAHYDQLVTSNALDPTLARRIEAYRHVSTPTP